MMASRVTTRGCGLVLALAVSLLLPGSHAARADGNWKSSNAVWQQMDRCARSAQKQFPDYTREANAKREAARQACLRASAAPTDTTPAPPPSAGPAPTFQR
jgi:hypothetical protein